MGNLFKDPQRKDRKYGKSGKLLEDKASIYKYNSEGFLAKKISKTQSTKKRFSLIVENDDLTNRETWHYLWAADGSLKSVINPDGIKSKYEYDALGRRTAKIINNKEINRYIYDGNVLLHEWKYNLEDRPKLSVDPNGNLSYEGEEPIDKHKLTTWVFDENQFSPTAKLVGDKQYSIITDYLGTPVEAYDVDGKKVWECELDVYGKIRKCVGNRNFIPFRYQGQYEDEETGLYYNRFRYYNPESGGYISQDPIGLAGNNPNVYAYTKDVNEQVDLLGLSACEKLKNLRSTSPFHIPGNARVKAQVKAGGYDQVRFRWRRGAFNYEARWHTATPNAPAGTPANWRVSRKRRGHGGVDPVYEELVLRKSGNSNEWVLRDDWQAAEQAYGSGIPTPEQTNLLNRGHFDVPSTNAFDISPYVTP